MKDNLLRTTVFDNDLELNIGNDQDAFKCLWGKYKALNSSIAKGIEQRAVLYLDQQNPPETPQTPPEPPTIPLESGTPEDDEEDQRQLKEEEERRKEEERIRREAARRKAVREKADSFLLDSGISTHMMNIDGFLKDVRKSGNGRFDLIT